jgi:hypothetical protein
VLAAIRVMNRLELVAETLRAALNALATVAPAWLQAMAPTAWYARERKRSEDTRLPQGQASRDASAQMVGEEGFALLDALAIPVRHVPGVCGAFDLHHGGAQRLPKGAGCDQHGDSDDDPEQAQRASPRLARHRVAPRCDLDPTIEIHRSKSRYHGGRGQESLVHRA